MPIAHSRYMPNINHTPIYKYNTPINNINHTPIYKYNAPINNINHTPIYEYNTPLIIYKSYSHLSCAKTAENLKCLRTTRKLYKRLHYIGQRSS